MISFKTYSIKEVAEMFGFSYSFIRSLIMRGEIPYHIAGKDRYFFTDSDVEVFLQKTERKPTDTTSNVVTDDTDAEGV